MAYGRLAIVGWDILSNALYDVVVKLVSPEELVFILALVLLAFWLAESFEKWFNKNILGLPELDYSTRSPPDTVHNRDSATKSRRNQKRKRNRRKRKRTSSRQTTL